MIRFNFIIFFFDFDKMNFFPPFPKLDEVIKGKMRGGNEEEEKKVNVSEC